MSYSGHYTPEIIDVVQGFMWIVVGLKLNVNYQLLHSICGYGCSYNCELGKTHYSGAVFGATWIYSRTLRST